MQKALADHQSGILIQSDGDLDLINANIRLAMRRIEEIGRAQTEAATIEDASTEAEPTFSDLADIEQED